MQTHLISILHAEDADYVNRPAMTSADSTPCLRYSKLNPAAHVSRSALSIPIVFLGSDGKWHELPVCRRFEISWKINRSRVALIPLPVRACRRGAGFIKNRTCRQSFARRQCNSHDFCRG